MFDKRKKAAEAERGYIRVRNLILKQEGTGTLISIAGKGSCQELESVKIMSIPH
jgi:hypothetical protein